MASKKSEYPSFLEILRSEIGVLTRQKESIEAKLEANRKAIELYENHERERERLMERTKPTRPVKVKATKPFDGV